ncbi:hypothetical protein HK405_008060 [Cladochytrium tenue]|nr:hypothetical protein HK405_008060 [Cladochytrium tenue]
MASTPAAAAAATVREEEEVLAHGHPGSSDVDASNPATAAGAGAHAPPRNIVVCAVDFSENSRRAFEWCLHNLFDSDDRKANDQLTSPVDFSISGDFSSSLGPAREWLDAVEAGARSAAHDLLRSLAGEAVTVTGLRHVRAIALRGDPREEIAAKVEQIRPALLVVGSRGMGTVARLFVGSVSDHLMHHVSCPVTVVKAPPPPASETAAALPDGSPAAQSTAAQSPSQSPEHPPPVAVSLSQAIRVRAPALDSAPAVSAAPPEPSFRPFALLRAARPPACPPASTPDSLLSTEVAPPITAPTLPDDTRTPPPLSPNATLSPARANASNLTRPVFRQVAEAAAAAAAVSAGSNSVGLFTGAQRGSAKGELQAGRPGPEMPPRPDATASNSPDPTRRSPPSLEQQREEPPLVLRAPPGDQDDDDDRRPPVFRLVFGPWDRAATLADGGEGAAFLHRERRHSHLYNHDNLRHRNRSSVPDNDFAPYLPRHRSQSDQNDLASATTAASLHQQHEPNDAYRQDLAGAHPVAAAAAEEPDRVHPSTTPGSRKRRAAVEDENNDPVGGDRAAPTPAAPLRTLPRAHPPPDFDRMAVDAGSPPPALSPHAAAPAAAATATGPFVFDPAALIRLCRDPPVGGDDGDFVRRPPPAAVPLQAGFRKVVLPARGGIAAAGTRVACV